MLSFPHYFAKVSRVVALEVATLLGFTVFRDLILDVSGLRHVLNRCLLWWDGAWRLDLEAGEEVLVREGARHRWWRAARAWQLEAREWAWDALCWVVEELRALWRGG